MKDWGKCIDGPVNHKQFQQIDENSFLGGPEMSEEPHELQMRNTTKHGATGQQSLPGILP